MKSTAETGSFAIIGDLVGSRSHPERAAVQDALLAALAEVNARVDGLQPLEPTIGDEFQGVQRGLHGALLATLLVRLHLPDGMDARFGIGWGAIEIVGESAYGLTQDGPAWWAARDAIVEVKERQSTMPQLRTAISWPDLSGAGATRHDASIERERHALTEAYLECRDFLVSGFDARQRRLTAGLLDGRSMTALAKAEGVSVSAVSQRIRTTGVRTVVTSVRATDPGTGLGGTGHGGPGLGGPGLGGTGLTA